MFYKNLQFCCCKFSFGNFRRFSTYFSGSVELVMDIFGFSKSKARNFVINYKLARKDPEDINQSYLFCKTIGYSNEDILKNPKLLVSHPLQKFHQMRALEETGCKKVPPRLLSSAMSYGKKQIIYLKNDGYLDNDVNVVDEFLKHLDPPIEKPVELDTSLDKIDRMIWSEVHKVILENWLKRRLNATDDDLIKLFRIHKMIKNKSFRVIGENIKFVESLGISHEKLLKCGYLMNNYPEYPKEVLRDFPYISGLDVRKAMKANPKLIMISPKNILKIYGILKEFNIPDERIRVKHQIFTMNPETVRFRLQEINRIPELRVFLNHPYVLRLVLHQVKVKSRLTYMQQLQLKCASFKVLTCENDDVFDNYIQMGKDMNQFHDVLTFLSTLFRKDKNEVRDKIKRHPFAVHVPFLNMHDTYNFLIQQGYTKNDIYKALHIVLYPRSKIEKAIAELKFLKDVDFYNLEPAKRLHIILYHIEKDYHFTGNGVWTSKCTAISVSEEKNLE